MQQEPRLAAELDSEVTVAANGYSPPTPAPTHTSLILSKSNSTKKKKHHQPRKNLQHVICPYIVNNGVSKLQALPSEPNVIKTAVATKIFFLPFIGKKQFASFQSVKSFQIFFSNRRKLTNNVC